MTPNTAQSMAPAGEQVRTCVCSDRSQLLCVKWLNTKIRNEKEVGVRWPKQTHVANTGGEERFVRSINWVALSMLWWIPGRETWSGFAARGLFCQAHQHKVWLQHGRYRAICSRDVLESEAGLGWDLWAVLRGWFSSGWCCGSKEHHALPTVWFISGLPPTLPLLHVSQTKSWTFPASALGFSPTSLSQSTWRGEAAWDRIDGSTCSAPCHPHHKPPGTGAGPQHVLLHVFKVLLSHPSQPMGHLCAVSFITWHLHLVIGHQNQAPWLYKACFQKQDNNNVLLLRHFLHRQIFVLPCIPSSDSQIFLQVPNCWRSVCVQQTWP